VTSQRTSAGIMHMVFEKGLGGRRLAFMVFLLSAAFAACQIGWKAADGQFYQTHYAPAVMLSCDGVFGRPRTYSNPLNEFLKGTQKELDCAELKREGFEKPTPFQSAHLYLMGTVAGLWALFGVSWHNIIPLNVVLYAASVTAAFCIFRLALSKPLSFVLAAVFALSALHLGQLPHLRDYSKAPFILWAVYATGSVLTRPRALRALVLLSAAVGGMIGVGVGFRMDVILMLPPFLAAIFLVPSIGKWPRMKAAILSAAACVLVFAVVSFPIMSALGGASNTFHVLLLGLTAPFDQALGIRSAPYEFGPVYNDEYIADVVTSFAQRAGLAADHLLVISTKEYDRAGAAYYIHLALNFPADIIVRYYAAVLKLLSSVAAADLVSDAPPRLAEFLNGQALFVPWIALALVSLLCLHSVPLAVLVLAYLLYLSGYPSLQFSPRHYFHLQVVPLMVIGMFVQLPMQWARKRFQRDCSNPSPSATRTNENWLRPLLFAATFLAFAFSTLAVARLWQQPHLVELFETQSRKVTVPIAKAPVLSSGAAFFPLPEKQTVLPLRSNYWLFDFDGALCGRDNLLLRAKYTGETAVSAFPDSPVRIYPRTTYMMASYSRAGHQFLGVELPEEDASCLSRIRRMDDLGPSAFALTANLVEGWQQRPLYQGLSAFERVNAAPRMTPEFIVLDHGRPVKRAALLSAIGALPDPDAAAVTFRSDNVKFVGSSMELAGPVTSSYSYFLKLPEVHRAAPSYFLVEGTVRSGGMTAGLIQDGKWVAQGNVTTPGPFVIAIAVQPGTYIPTLANNVPGMSSNDLSIGKAGWVDVQSLGWAGP
jgi:hypothetical protein